MLLPLHIAGGGLAIILGSVALIASKGKTVHRRAGLLFVYAMLTMAISGIILAMRQSWTNGNVMGGLMTSYFVVTALTAVRPVSAGIKRLNVAALILVSGLTIYNFAIGFQAIRMPGGEINGVPFFMMFFMGTVLGLAAAGDIRLIRAGSLRPRPRIARHLWRMCFALFIAAGSFFSIRARVAKVLPEPFTTPMMRALPVLLVFVAMFYWLWRVRTRRFTTFVTPSRDLLSTPGSPVSSTQAR